MINFVCVVFLTFAICTFGYDLVREYSGRSFFDAWTYYDLYDNLTLGDVIWVDKDTANTGGLTFVTNQNTAVIRVDNYTTVPFNQKRNSVRITSNDSYALGSLWIFDAVHLPFGCSVWPAWWTVGPDWPEFGEIDIIENINLAKMNQMAVHTTPGCNHTAAPDQPGISGQTSDCSLPSGCVVGDPDPRSWGQAFADAGGGVWATQFDVAGIFIWFWSRADLPKNLLPSAQATPLDISAWGPPTGSWLATSCNISQFFAPQQLVIDVTLCGDWAGVPVIYTNTCAAQLPNDLSNTVPSTVPRTPSCYADNVVGPGARFDEAYFEINHIRAYTTAATPVSPSTASNKASSTQGVAAADNRQAATASAPQSMVPVAVICAAWGVLLGAGILFV